MLLLSSASSSIKQRKAVSLAGIPGPEFKETLTQAQARSGLAPERNTCRQFCTLGVSLASPSLGPARSLPRRSDEAMLAVLEGPA